MPTNTPVASGLDQAIALMTSLKGYRLRQSDLDPQMIRGIYRSIRELPNALDEALREIKELTAAGLNEAIRDDGALGGITSIAGVLTHVAEIHETVRSESYALDGWPETI